MGDFKINPGKVKETVVKVTTYEPVEAPTVEEKTVEYVKTYKVQTKRPESIRVYGQGKIKIRKGNELLGRIGMAIAALKGVETYGGLPGSIIEEAKATSEACKDTDTAYKQVLKTSGGAKTVAETIKEVDSTGLVTKVEE